jgi:endoglycosylceramidase
VAAALAVAMVATACTTLVPRPGGAREAGWRPVLPALHAAPDPVAGGRIVDALGREVVLRGVNVNAFAEYWRYGTFPTTFPFTASDAGAISGVGWNVVRLLVSWSRVEPQPGRYDDGYLDQVAAAVRRLEQRGVYTIVDLHQDAWGPALVAAPGAECPAGTTPAFGWDGAPAWATLDGGASRCVPADVRELSPAVRAAFSAFWRDAPGPGGVGIRARYTAMLGHLAQRFARTSAVAGYDVMNEPNAFGSEEVAALGALSGEAVAAIRAGEQRGHGFPHLVLVEPSATWSDFGVGTPPSFPHDADLVFAPHLYRGGLTSGPIPPEDFDRARADAAVLGGAPVLVGEWGSGPERASNPADGYFRLHQELQAEHRFSATLWTWRESCGDPHKAGDARAGRVPSVWGEFEVDCRTNSVLGPRSALVAQLERGYVRAAPGIVRATAYDATTGALTATGAAAPRGAVLVAWVPEPRAAVGVERASGLRAVKVSPSGSSAGVYVTAVATGGAWDLAVGRTSG